MHTLRVRPFLYFAMGVAVTAVAAWSMSAWRASAAVSADESTFVNVSPTRILDTREDIGLLGPFNSLEPQDLKVTGSIDTKLGPAVVVPDGATGVILNVTAVNPTAAGFVSIRPADAPGVPTTSSLNFNAGDIIPNSVTVQMPTSGGDAGKIEITYNAFDQAGPTTEILIDVVGYTKNSGLASLQAEVDLLEAQFAAATAPGAVGQEEIAPDAVTSSEIAPDAVGQAEIAPGAVGTGEIAPGAVGTDQVAAGAINSTHIVNNSLTALDLGPDSVGLSELNAVIDTFAIPINGDSLNDGLCDPEPVVITVPAATVGAQTLVLLARLTDTGVVNAGWAVEGLPTTIQGFARVQVCNYTGTNQLEQPSITISYILLGA